MVGWERRPAAVDYTVTEYEDVKDHKGKLDYNLHL